MKLSLSIPLYGLLLFGDGVIARRSKTASSSNPTQITADLGSASGTVLPIPLATYVPAVHWETNTTDTVHLKPATNVTFMYGDPETNASTGAVNVAFTQYNFKYPVVALEKSAHVQDVQCTNASMTVKFNSPKAYRVAKAWQTSNFLLVGYGYRGCDTSYADDRFWALVLSRSFDDAQKMVTASIKMLPVEEAAVDSVITWGQHVLNDTSTDSTPDNSTSSNGVMPLHIPSSSPKLYTYTITRSTSSSTTDQSRSVITSSSIVSQPILSTVITSTSSSSKAEKRDLHVRAGCNKDLLLRAFIKTSGPASSFCSTFMAATASAQVATVTSTTTGSTSIVLVTKTTTLLQTIGISTIVSTTVTTTSTSTVISTSTSAIYTSQTLSKRAVASVDVAAAWTSKFAAPALSSACSCISVTVGDPTTSTSVKLATTTPVATSTLLSSITVSSSIIAATNVQTTSIVTIGYSYSTTTLYQTVTVPVYNVDTSNLTAVADFDTMLDDLLGYLDPASFPTVDAFLAVFAPGLAMTSNKRDINKRFSFPSPKSLISSAVSSVASAAKAVVPAVVNTVTKVATVAVQAVAAIIPDINLTPLDTTLSVSLPPAGSLGTLQNTMFGNGYLLWSDSSNVVNVYCVQCGFTGSMSIKGQISYNVGKGFTQASINMNGNMQLSLTAAFIVNQQKISKQWQKTFVKVPLSPFKIPGILTVGPQASFAVGGTAMAQASGGIQAGFVIGWTPAVVVDLLNMKNSGGSGFTPTFSPVVNLKSDISASLSAYVLGSLTVGVDVLSGKWVLDGGLYEKGTLQANLVSQIDASIGGGVQSSCLGATVNFAFINDIYVAAEVLGVSATLNHLEKALPSTCIGFAQPSKSSTSSSQVTTTNPSISSTTSTGIASTISSTSLQTTTAPITSTGTSSRPSSSTSATVTKPKYTPPPLAGGGPMMLPDFDTTQGWDNWQGAFEVTDQTMMTSSGTPAFKDLQFSDPTPVDVDVGLRRCKAACDSMQLNGTDCQSIIVYYTASSALGCDFFASIQTSASTYLPLAMDPSFIEAYRSYNRPTGSSRKFSLFYNTTDGDYDGIHWLGENGLYPSQTLYTLDASSALTYMSGTKSRKVCSPPNKPFDDLLEYCYNTAYVPGSWTFDNLGNAIWTRSIGGVSRVSTQFTMRTFYQWNPSRVYPVAWWNGDISSCGQDCDGLASLVRVVAVDPAAQPTTSPVSSTKSTSTTATPTPALPTLQPITGASCPASNGTVVQGQDGKPYQILCSMDFISNIIGSTANSQSLSSCLADCIAWTQNNPGNPCGSVMQSISTSQCLIQGINDMTTLSTSLFQPASIINTIVPVTYASSASCSTGSNKLYTSTTGAVYSMYCNTVFGTDVVSTTADSFGSCINACAGQTSFTCVGVSYQASQKTCTFKSAVYSNQWTTASSDWQSAVLSSYPMAFAPGVLNLNMCPDASGKYYSSSGKNFYMRCDYDIWGGDITMIKTPTFSLCMDTCAKTTGCVGVGYYIFDPENQTCFMKSVMNYGMLHTSVGFVAIAVLDSYNQFGQL